jgi:Metallo-beta-lactamase superfamily
VSAPASDELELSIFGRGFGECVLVHVGDRRWVLVDSCRDDAGDPVALTYLGSLDDEAEDRIVAVVITHWDDDHTKGATNVIQAHAPREVWMPAVLDNDEAFDFAVTHDVAMANTGVPSGLSEFRSILHHVDRSRRMWGIRRRDVDTTTSATVFLLSPHDAVVSEGFAALGITQNPGFGELASPEPNDTSIALWVNWDERSALLGADLKNGEWGWQAVLQAWPSARAPVGSIKVPHHGSPNAHLDEVFTQLCDAEVLAGVTRFTPGTTPRPSDDDRDRLRPLLGQGWVVGAEGPSRRQPRTVEELHEQAVTLDGLWDAHGAVGQLRIRCDSDGQWSTERIGAVTPV